MTNLVSYSIIVAIVGTSFATTAHPSKPRLQHQKNQCESAIIALRKLRTRGNINSPLMVRNFGVSVGNSIDGDGGRSVLLSKQTLKPLKGQIFFFFSITLEGTNEISELYTLCAVDVKDILMIIPIFM